ncbi:MAG: hypothetical protein IKS07_10280 [Lachnospiraceae bacterium]|nr:hypothetical protein [Lachnospiraceae bacterium]
MWYFYGGVGRIRKKKGGLRKVGTRTKMSRQLELYFELTLDRIHGPADLMRRFRIGRRMLQRDLKDLRDSGLIRVRYDHKKDDYVQAGDAIFDESASDRRREHLLRLYRIGTLITQLPVTSWHSIDRYEMGLREYADYLDYAKEDPENNPPEDYGDMYAFFVPDPPVFYDLKSAYHALFPSCSHRTRERDFREMRNAGFGIFYSRHYKTYIYLDPEES